MSTRIRTTSPKTAKARTSKARARSNNVAASAALLDAATASRWPQDLRAGVIAAELMLAEASDAVTELASTAAQRARSGGRRAVEYARTHPAQVLVSAIALGVVAARLWSTRAAARS